MNELSNCVACGSGNWSVTETWLGYKLANCSECGLTFTANPDYEQERYIALYENISREIPVPEKHSHVYVAPKQRLVWESMAFPNLIPPPQLAPAEHLILAWLRSHVVKHSLIIDCGCGIGRFLQVLSRAGFRGVGVELSRALVELLNQRGFEALVGAAPDFAWDGPQPCAITLFEVLEHLPDPVAVIGPLKERFPHSHVLASVPSALRASLLLKGRRGPFDYPPNHFLRWTPTALEQLFLRTGYSRVRVILPSPIGFEMLPSLGQIMFSGGRFSGHGSGRRERAVLKPDRHVTLTKNSLATLALWIIATYRTTANTLGFPLAAYAKSKGASAESMIVIAEA